MIFDFWLVHLFFAKNVSDANRIKKMIKRRGKKKKYADIAGSDKTMRTHSNQ